MRSLRAFLSGTGTAPDPPEHRTVAVAATHAYTCRICDVLGVAVGDDPLVCWCCGGDTLVPR